jgi:hypothetical protein
MAQPLHIFLITIHGWRGDFFRSGNDQSAMPLVRQLMEKSLIFPKAYAQATQTAFSVPSLLSGILPSQLRKYDFLSRYTGVSMLEAESLPEYLMRLGYYTIGLHGDCSLTLSNGLEKAFDFYHDFQLPIARNTSLERGVVLLFHQIRRWAGGGELVPANKLIDKLIRMVDEIEAEGSSKSYSERTGKDHTHSKAARSVVDNWGRSIFAWIHLNEMPRPQVTRDGYHAALQRVDESIARLVAYLQERNGFDQSLIILTGDHGVAFEEEEMDDPAWPVGDRLAHVPLIFYLMAGHQPLRYEYFFGLNELSPLVKGLVEGMAESSFAAEQLYAATLGVLQKWSKASAVTELMPACSPAPPWILRTPEATVFNNTYTISVFNQTSEKIDFGDGDDHGWHAQVARLRLEYEKHLVPLVSLPQEEKQQRRELNKRLQALRYTHKEEGEQK